MTFDQTISTINKDDKPGEDSTVQAANMIFNTNKNSAQKVGSGYMHSMFDQEKM